MRFSTRQSSHIRGFDLTPMIDVVFQLMIFFLFTAQFGELSRTAIDLPRLAGEQKQSAAKPTFVLDINEHGELFLQSDPVSLDGFVAIVSREIERAGGADSVSIRVRPDRLSRAADLNRVTRRVATLGVSRWSIATVSTPGEGSP